MKLKFTPDDTVLLNSGLDHDFHELGNISHLGQANLVDIVPHIDINHLGNDSIIVSDLPRLTLVTSSNQSFQDASKIFMNKNLTLVPDLSFMNGYFEPTKQHVADVLVLVNQKNRNDDLAKILEKHPNTTFLVNSTFFFPRLQSVFISFFFF